MYYHTLFVKNPSETFNYLAYIEPISYLSWAFIILFCALVPPVLCLTARLVHVLGFYNSQVATHLEIDIDLAALAKVMKMTKNFHW